MGTDARPRRSYIGGMPIMDLIMQARQARTFAYCPYSNYAVGAALLADDGTVYLGCNVENAAYGVCLCAERNALGTAVAAGRRRFSAIAIAGEGDMPYPCGACRQALFEFGKDLTVLIANGHQVEETTLAALLPHGFSMHEGS